MVKTDCQRVLGDGSTTFSVFTLFDGHNGSAASIYAKEYLMKNILSAIPSDLNRDEWIAALPRSRQTKNSRRQVVFLHWIYRNRRLRITSSGCEVGKLNTGGGTEIGPLRCWPGGLCLSRSIGDMDVGEFIVPVPYLSTAGGRLILSSDGVWDILSAEEALDCCRGMPSDAAAAQIVKDAVGRKGLRDDTTCIVIDILPQEKTAPPLGSPKKHRKGGVISKLFKKKSSEKSSSVEQEYHQPDTGGNV